MHICIVIYTHTTSLNFARLLQKSILVAATILCWQDSACAFKYLHNATNKGLNQWSMFICFSARYAWWLVSL